MVASENPEVIESKQMLITTYVLDYEEAYEDGYIDNDGDSLDEEDDNVLGEVGVRTGVTKSGTEEVEEVQQVVKSSSLLYYMLKPTSLLTQGFNTNKMAQEKVFKHMCNYGARV